MDKIHEPQQKLQWDNDSAAKGSILPAIHNTIIWMIIITAVNT